MSEIGEQIMDYKLIALDEGVQIHRIEQEEDLRKLHEILTEKIGK